MHGTKKRSNCPNIVKLVSPLLLSGIVLLAHAPASSQTGTYFADEPSWQSSLANRTQCVVFGDVDGDGDLDLICGNRSASLIDELTILYINEGGTFSMEPAWTGPPEYDTRSLALGDVDGDGDLDLVCGHYRGGNMLFLNVGGDSVFAGSPAWVTSVGDQTFAVALGDVDDDGDLDLVCGNSSQQNCLYLNEGGDSVFATTPAWVSPSSTSTYGVALGDVDGDDDLDLLCDLELYRNDGGLFEDAPAWVPESGYFARSVVFGDMDGDGDLDIVCARGYMISLFSNVGGDSVFAANPASSMETTGGMMSVDLGDVDGDGDLDVVYGLGESSYDRGSGLCLNDSGMLQPMPAWSVTLEGTNAVALADVDGDGDLDLACGNNDAPNTLYLNTGGVLSATPDWISASIEFTTSVVLVDVDLDGDLDLVSGHPYCNEHGPALYRNDSGTLTASPSWSLEECEYTMDIAVGDIDGDGYPDLVCGNRDEFQSNLRLNRGGIFEEAPVWYSTTAVLTYAVDLGDVDGDGDLDLACGSSSRTNTLYLNEGGTFTGSPVWASYGNYYTVSVALADADGDGDLDLHCGNMYDGERLYINEGGIFNEHESWVSGPFTVTRSIAVGDIDDDGDYDLVCGNGVQRPIGQHPEEEPNTLYEGMRNPAYPGDPAAPANHLANNGAFIRSVTVSGSGENLYTVGFTAFDVEADPVWLVTEYQYSGEPVWRPMRGAGYSGKVGPFSSSPAGARHEFNWDVSLLPFDARRLTLRLRVVSFPKRVGVMQHVSAYLKDVGVIRPIRPELSTSIGVLSFPVLTVGDTASVDFDIMNTGNAELTIHHVGLPSVEMRLDRALPISISPGESAMLGIYLEPITGTPIAGECAVSSNDPITPVYVAAIVTDVRALRVSSRPLTAVPEVPLGEALTVIVTPAPGVRVEQGYLYHRPAGGGAFADSIALARSADEFIAVIPGAAVTEAGLEYYVRVENSGIFAVDPPGAPNDSLFFQAVEPPTALSSAPVPNEGGSYVEGRDIRVQITMPDGAVFKSGTLYYRRGGEEEYVDAGILAGELLPYAVIPDTAAGPRGLEYWVEVHTMTSRLTDPPSRPETYPRSIPVISVNLAEPQSHPGEQYRMLSVPLGMEGTIMGAVSDDIGGADNTRWRMFAYDADRSDYVEIPNDDIFAFRRTEAYWLITKDGHTIDTGPARGVSAPTDGNFPVRLAPGWNMVGDPFAFPVAWDSCLVDTIGGQELTMIQAAGVVIEPPVRWDASGGYSYGAAVLEPFDGYWVRNLTDGEIILEVPPRGAVYGTPGLRQNEAADEETGGSSPCPSRPELGVEADIYWALSIAASSCGACDRSNMAGIVRGASAGRDRYDRSEPPMAPGRAVSLYFVLRDGGGAAGRYSIDMRGECTGRRIDRTDSQTSEHEPNGYLWTFDVAKSFAAEAAGDETVLIFEGMETVPDEFSIYLVDRVLDRMIDLRAETEYRFILGTNSHPSSEEDARFVLLAGGEEFIEGQILPSVPT
ncbi:MAG TPA: FG-GAP-like repeat-containing protein, partial [Patescibacteria group bacterium]|nr:FG-GAP-like repeat-containing protein [Patescibacteria group bacterium]